MAIIVNLDMMLAKRKMTSLELANRVGMTPAKAKETLEGKGLFLRATGVGGDYNASVTAASQSIDSGSMVARGSVIEVRFVSTVIDYAGNG